MGQISDIKNPWRQKLLSAPASFRGVIFHVETGSISGGRRTVVHEYPKRDTPYAEDMGRHAWRYQFTGYLIYKPAGGGGKQVPGVPLTPLFGDNSSLRYDYVDQRDKLMAALDRDDAGTLMHPVFCSGGKLVMCERYSMSETRERGGYTSFDMSFVFAGTAGNSMTVTNTGQDVATKATGVDTAATTTFNQGAFAGQGFGGGSTA